MDLAINIFLVQFVLIILIFLAIAIFRYIFYLKEKKDFENKDELESLFTRLLNEKKIISISDIPEKLRGFRNLLEVTEVFNHNFSSSIWINSRDALIGDYLFSRAKKYLSNGGWHKRLLGLRCISLSPKKFMIDDLVLSLLNDKHFLVRIEAAKCIVDSQKNELFLPVIQQMTKEEKLTRFPYRDILIQGNGYVKDRLKELLETQEDLEIIAICLDILSYKPTHNELKYAKEYIKSPNKDCKLAAIKILSHLPGEDTEKSLLKGLEDKDSSVCLAALEALGKLHAINRVSSITPFLESAEWQIRYEAARVLRSLGSQGASVLYKAMKHPVSQTSEIAEYMLNLPKGE